MIWNVASTRDEISLRKWSGGTSTAHLRMICRGTLVKKKRFVDSNAHFSLTFFCT